jgi:hypothetical protein
MKMSEAQDTTVALQVGLIKSEIPRRRIIHVAARVWSAATVPVLKLPCVSCHTSSFYISSAYFLLPGHTGTLVGLGTMLQTGRSPDRFPMRSLDFFN